MGSPFSTASSDPVEQALRRADEARKRAGSVPDIGGRRHKILANGALENGAPLSARVSHGRQQISSGQPLHRTIQRALEIAGDVGRDAYAHGGGAEASAGGLHPVIASALEIARQATLAHGGGVFGANPALHALPGSTPLPKPPGPRARLPNGAVPVLPLGLAGLYARHAVKLRPHFDDGGSDNSGSDNGNDGGYGGYGGGYGGYGGGYGDNLGSLGMGANANIGASGLGIGGFGGSVSSVSNGSSNSTSNGADYGGGWNSMSVGNDNTTTMGRNIGSVASLGNSGGNTGYSYSHTSQGNDDGGYAGYSGGDIGPSGIATGGGWSGGYTAPSGYTGLAGFGNFGSGSLGDTSAGGPYAGGLNSASEYGYTPSLGSDGYSGLNNYVEGQLGHYALGSAGPSFSTNPLGIGAGGDTTSSPGFGSFQMSQNPGFASGAVTGDEAPASSTDTSPYGTLAGVYGAPFSGPAVSSSPSSLANVAQAAFGPSRLGMFGSFSNNTDQNAQNTVGAAGLNGVPSFARASPADLGAISAAAPQYGVLSSLQGAPGTLAGDLVGNPAFGSVAAPTSYNYGFQTPDMPGFASGALVGDEPPDTLATPQQVRNFALMNMAQNFGALYGDKFGLPSNFGFSDPAFVAAIVNGAQQQESKFNPASISPDGGIGLAQMTAGGKYAHAIGPYSGAASDPGADRASSLLGFVGQQAGVDPASLDPRQVGIQTAQAALSDVPGVYNNEEAFGLAQLATNPMYAKSLAAVSSPTMSPQDAEATYTKNFENPDPAKANLAAREAAAASYYGLGQQQEAALGLAGPARVGPGLSGVTGPNTVGVGPTTSTPAGAGTTGPSGTPSVTDGQTAPAASTSPYGTLGGLSPSDFTSASLPSLTTNPPSYTSPDTTAPVTTPTDTTTPPGTVTLPKAPTYHDPDAPTTAPQQQDGITPDYMPGEKTALEAFINGLVGIVGGPIGLANGLSALVGGPNAGGWIADHSRPGNPAAPSGNGNSHNNPVANLDATASPVAQTYTTAPSTSTYTGTNATTATQAYLDALKTLPGPAARKANPVPLVAPGRNIANFYNPLNDPTVIAALRAARSG